MTSNMEDWGKQASIRGGNNNSNNRVSAAGSRFNYGM